MYRSSNGSRDSRFNSNRRPFNRFAAKGRSSGGNSHAKYIKKTPTEVVAEEAYVPTLNFETLAINPMLKANLLKKGFKNPTPIQDKAIPHVMQGKDIIGIANTGTGKTGAFLIPLIEKIKNNRDEKVIIIIPTRELAMQIQDELRSFSSGMQIFSVLCIGGGNMRQQIYELRRNPQFVIGTPGRLKDLIERKVLNLSQYSTFILDEVDRMLDMGFIQDIKYITSLLPEKRQTLFFSATLSNDIQRLTGSFMKDPLVVSVKSQDTAKNVDQDVVIIKGAENKVEILHDLLKKTELKKVLIFGRTKFGVERLAGNLFQKGFKVASIHGDKPQFKRQQAIRMFKENVVTILVATDVAARGLDIADITHVINFDEPASYDDYIHRIGRTGRGNKKGNALTFV